MAQRRAARSAPPPVDTSVSDADRKRLQAVVPMIATHFRRASADMPPRLREAFQSKGLTNRHGAVLTAVLVAESLSVGELASRLGIGLTNASQLAGDLDRAGWLRRHRAPDNQRRTLLSLPDERRPDVAEFVARRSASLMRAMATLTPEQQSGFLAGLQAWAAEVEA
jgi:DNA-binding MarR family transcriptional regulator